MQIQFKKFKAFFSNNIKKKQLLVLSKQSILDWLDTMQYIIDKCSMHWTNKRAELLINLPSLVKCTRTFTIMCIHIKNTIN